MHSPDTINRFIELRAEGKSYRTIGEILKISTGLAAKWAADHDAEIQHLAFARREALREQYLASFESKLADLSSELVRIDAELKERDLQDVSTEFLLRRKTCLQSRAEKFAADPEPTPFRTATPPPAIEQS
jgi:hypothetical protein